MKKVFILEDNPEAMPIVDWLKSKRGLTVIHARSVEDTIYYLEYDKGNPINSYDCFIFDAHIPAASCPSVTGEKLEFFDSNRFNGLLLLERYKSQIENAKSKVCIYSGFGNLLKSCYPDLLSEFHLINKGSETLLKDLSRFIFNI